MTPSPEKLELLRRYFDGAATDMEYAALQDAIRRDWEFRRFFVRYAGVDAALGGSLALESDSAGAVCRASPPAARSARGRYAVAGIGLMCGIALTLLAVVLLGYAAQRATVIDSPSFHLADGDFEDSAGETASGFPTAFGIWSGDACAVEGKTVGKKVLRFLRAGADPAQRDKPPASCDLFQLVDLRGLRSNGGSDDVFLELTASFRDGRGYSGTPIRFDCRLHVFSGNPDLLRAEWPVSRTQALAYGSGSHVSTGGEADRWSSVSAKVFLPLGADFALVQIVATHLGKRPSSHEKEEAVSFDAQFADHVVLALKTQPTWPVRLAGR